MSAGPLVFELIVVFCVAVFLLHHYGRITKQHPAVTVATLVAWYFSMIIVFILPLDVSSTFYRECLQSSRVIENVTDSSDVIADNVTTWTVAAVTTITTPAYQHTTTDNNSTLLPNSTTYQTNLNNSEFRQQHSLNNDSNKIIYVANTCEKPWSYVKKDTLPAMWHIVYWTSQFLTWLVLPFMQSYVCAGDFSTLGKMKRAVIENAVYYGSYLFIFGCLLIYVAAAPDLSLDMKQLKVILITASNTWGLFLLVLLLGYGLVEVPRGLWHAADNAISMAQTYFKLSKLSTEKQEAVEDLEDVLEEVKKVSSIVRYNHPVRKYVSEIILKCPDDLQSQMSQGMDDYEDYENSGRSRNEVPSENSLVKLHRKLIRAVHTKKRTAVQWRILMERGLHLENIAKNEISIDRYWREEFPTTELRNAVSKFMCTPGTKWWWYCKIQPLARRILAACLILLSIMVVWSECTFFNEKPVLSLFAIFINLAKKNYDYYYIELASCLTISYLCVCAYYTVFRLKVFNFYYIAGHHQTDETSLLFVGITLCRLTAPLCLNFLGMIHLDTHITAHTGVETAYTQIMGHLDVISFISDGFNIYFPILVCVLCVGTYFNIGQRCLSVLGFQRFVGGNDDLTSDLIEEGRQLVNREKRKMKLKFKSLERSERSRAYGHDTDMNTRQWHGKRMQNVENESDDASAIGRNNKRKNDKLELLNDVEPIDYSSTSNSRVRASPPLSESRWGSSSQPNYVANQPPKNIFDDV
ncbi:G-protein coupled receptor-associated protein LMBRD2-like isoform X1 [Ciona intestinalis]